MSTHPIESSASPAELVEQLHEYERAVLPLLVQTQDVEVICAKTGLELIQVQRAFQWLSNKKLVTFSYVKESVLVLDTHGAVAQEKGLSEARFFTALSELTVQDSAKQWFTLKDIIQQSGMVNSEAAASLGILKQTGAIQTRTTSAGLEITRASPTFSNPQVTALLSKSFPLNLDGLSASEQSLVKELQKRPKFFRIEVKQHPQVQLTKLGEQLIHTYVNELGSASASRIGTLTHAMLVSGEYKAKQFRPYDVSPVPKIKGARIHPLTAVIRELTSIFLEMGFSEMRGPWVETAFWCMDSMWIPQDHPARDVQDTFFLGKEGSLPDAALVSSVSKTHTKGEKESYKGYGYAWNPALAAQLVLRTHTTSVTYRTFAKNITPPAKCFAIDRVFRNEAIDATHLPEFHQAEGFVMAPGLTLAHLLGFIKEFYAKLGYTKIRFKPTYNPYTESSVEALYYDEKRGKWMELINSGIFRAESLRPYGINCPVIAWGMGVERVAMLMLGSSKLKDLVGPTTDVTWLSSYPSIPVRGSSW